MKGKTSMIVKLGAGFFADAYDLFVIDIVLAVLIELNESDPTGIRLTTSSKSLVSGATSAGAVVGMLLFGFLGDHFGRISAVISTGSIVSIGSLISAFCVRSDSFNLIYQLSLYRFLLGIGIGGEYPLSAVLANEKACPTVRSRIVAGVFSMQGVGMLSSALLAQILIALKVPLDLVWRILLGFGAVPALVAVFLRLRMTETTPYQESKELHAHKSGKEKMSEMWRIVKNYKFILLGTASTWFLLDVTFYGTGQFKTSVSEQMFKEDGKEQVSLENKVFFSLILSLMAIPGYLCAYLCIDKIGKWNLQVWGFVAMICCYLIMAIMALFKGASAYLQLGMFGLSFFFTNFGPNTTTFIIPSEVFPTTIKATCHGISAAFGKAGAVLGASGFPPLETQWRLSGVLFVCAGVALLGLWCTLLWVPKDKDMAPIKQQLKTSHDINESI